MKKYFREDVRILCQDTGQAIYYPFGTPLYEIIENQGIKREFPILGAYVNNKLRELSYRIFKPKIIRFTDITSSDGRRMYYRSLSFVLFKAVKDIYPKAVLNIDHSVSGGIYCEVENGHQLDAEAIAAIRQRMAEIIEKDLPFERSELPTKDAIELFVENGLYDKSRLLAGRRDLFTSVYRLDNRINYFYGHLVPSTGYLKVFGLDAYYDGLILRMPDPNNPEQLSPMKKQPKLFHIFREHKEWARLIDGSHVGQLNEQLKLSKASEFIKMAEALHEKKVVRIAEEIEACSQDVKLVLISGPSSSGKTTFSKRLAIQLKVAGLKPHAISLDDYFVNREDNPKDENGEYDFETIKAIDIELFNSNILDLMAGKEVQLPKFDFTEGKRVYNDNTLKIGKNDILIVEGIHGLNPELTAHIEYRHKFSIFISALTQISIDHQNYIPTTDNRLLRRLIRDARYRGYSALETLRRWPSVRRGEEKYIFPYQENADVMFNSALLYELGVIKNLAVPLLKSIPPDELEYSEATRLLKFLSYFKEIPDQEIPPTSLLREFLWGSSFTY